MVNGISILGCTGSIGRQTAAVAEYTGIRVAALTANRQVDRLEEQARRFHPEFVAVFDEEAAKLPPASDGLIILPYFLGEKTPIFDPLARGMMFGLTLSHTKAHIFRACLEAVIYGFKHHIDIIKELGYEPKNIIATNGGSRSKFWCQIASDVLDREVRAYPSHPGSALGVAFLAGMTAGVFDGWEKIHLFLKDYKTYTPNSEAAEIYSKSYKIYRSLYLETKESLKAVAELYS